MLQSETEIIAVTGVIAGFMVGSFFKKSNSRDPFILHSLISVVIGLVGAFLGKYVMTFFVSNMEPRWLYSVVIPGVSASLLVLVSQSLGRSDK